MSPLEDELVALRLQLEMNNASVASLCDAVERFGIAMETLIRALTDGQRGDSPVLMMLETLLSLAREHASLLGQSQR